MVGLYLKALFQNGSVVIGKDMVPLHIHAGLSSKCYKGSAELASSFHSSKHLGIPDAMKILYRAEGFTATQS